MNTAIEDFADLRRRFHAMLLPALLLFCPPAAVARMCGLAAHSVDPQPAVDPLTHDAFISTAALPVPDTIQYADKKGQIHTSLAFPGQVVVLMAKTTRAGAARALFQSHGGKVISQIPAAGFYVVQVGSGNERGFISAVNPDLRVNEAFPDMSLPSSGTSSGVMDLARRLNSVFSLNLAGIPFRVSSMDDAFFCRVGVFEGYVMIRPESLEVVVTEAMIAFRPQQDKKRVDSVESFGVGLGVVENKRWTIESRSQNHEINKVMKAGDTHTVRSVRFTIPKSPEKDLSKRWLIFWIIGAALDPKGEKGTTGWCYAHSDRNIFSRAGIKED